MLSLSRREQSATIQTALKPSRNKKGQKIFQLHLKWCLFLQQAAEKKTPKLAALKTLLQIFFGLTHTLILRTLHTLGMLCRLILCSQEHYTSQQILLPGALHPSTQFVPQNTLLLRTLCFLEHSAPQNTQFPGTHCSSRQFAHFKGSVPGNKVYH